MFGADLQLIDHVLITLNMFGVGFAIYWNVRGSKEAARTMQPIYASIAALATVYFIGYGLLLFGVVDPVIWQRIARGIGMVVWVVVWAGPPAASIRTKKQIEDSLEKMVEDRLSRDDGV
jgi:CHASE2 domain-containing sensor protein